MFRQRKYQLAVQRVGGWGVGWGEFERWWKCGEWLIVEEGMADGGEGVIGGEQAEGGEWAGENAGDGVGERGERVFNREGNEIEEIEPVGAEGFSEGGGAGGIVGCKPRVNGVEQGGGAGEPVVAGKLVDMPQFGRGLAPRLPQGTDLGFG